MKDRIEKLADRLIDLDQQAFLEFSKVFGPRFKGLFSSSGIPNAEAEDMATSCITDIILKVHQYNHREKGSFKAWVMTLARNALTDWWRKNRPADSLPDNLPEDIMLNHRIIRPRNDITLAVRDSLARLSENDQSIIELRHSEPSYSYTEISEYLNITSEAARVRHHRALKRLKEILENDSRLKSLIEKWTKPEDKKEKDD